MGRGAGQGRAGQERWPEPGGGPCLLSCCFGPLQVMRRGKWRRPCAPCWPAAARTPRPAPPLPLPQEALDTSAPGYQPPLPESEVRPLQDEEHLAGEADAEGQEGGGFRRGRGGRGGRCGPGLGASAGVCNARHMRNAVCSAACLPAGAATPAASLSSVRCYSVRACRGRGRGRGRGPPRPGDAAAEGEAAEGTEGGDGRGRGRGGRGGRGRGRGRGGRGRGRGAEGAPAEGGAAPAAASVPAPVPLPAAPAE